MPRSSTTRLNVFLQMALCLSILWFMWCPPLGTYSNFVPRNSSPRLKAPRKAPSKSKVALVGGPAQDNQVRLNIDKAWLACLSSSRITTWKPVASSMLPTAVYICLVASVM